MKTNVISRIFLGMLFISCKKEETEPIIPSPPIPTAPMVYSVEGEMNGVPFNWVVDGVNYEQNLSPYNTIDVSASNNFLRYGTSIGADNVNSIPYFMVEFSGFQGDSNDQLSAADFINYFQIGNYNYLTTANQDIGLGVNLLYENDLNYTDIHQSANITQPISSYFIIDSITPVQTSVNNTDVYLKVRFEATINDPTKPGEDILITNGVMRMLIDNFYEL